MKKMVPVIAAAVTVLALYGLDNLRDDSAVSQAPTQAPQTASAAVAGDQVIQAAYENRQSDVQVEGAGRVVKVLPDDNEGSRHQKFILELASGGVVHWTHHDPQGRHVDGWLKHDGKTFQ